MCSSKKYKSKSRRATRILIRLLIFLGAISGEAQSDKKFALRAYVRKLSQQVEFIIDTGANVTCIPTNLISDKLKDKLDKTDRLIISPDDKKLLVI